MKETANERVFRRGKHDKYVPRIYYMKKEMCSKFYEERRRRDDQVERAKVRGRHEEQPDRHSS